MSRWNITWEDTLGSVSCVHITMKNKCIEARLFVRRNSGFCFWKWCFFPRFWEPRCLPVFEPRKRFSEVQKRRLYSIFEHRLPTPSTLIPLLVKLSWEKLFLCLNRGTFGRDILRDMKISLLRKLISSHYTLSLSNKLFQWFSLSLLVKYFRI